MAQKYAKGSRAWGICGRSGRKMILRDMVFDGRFPNMRVDPDWFEDQHPQERMPKVEDPVALYRPSPEVIAGPTAPVLTVLPPDPSVFTSIFEFTAGLIDCVQFDSNGVGIRPLTGFPTAHDFLNAPGGTLLIGDTGNTLYAFVAVDFGLGLSMAVLGDHTSASLTLEFLGADSVLYNLTDGPASVGLRTDFGDPTLQYTLWEWTGIPSAALQIGVTTTVTLTAPFSLDLVGVGGGSSTGTTLTWSPAETGITEIASYTIMRSVDSGPFAELITCNVLRDFLGGIIGVEHCTTTPSIPHDDSGDSGSVYDKVTVEDAPVTYIDAAISAGHTYCYNVIGNPMGNNQSVAQGPPSPASNTACVTL